MEKKKGLSLRQKQIGLSIGAAAAAVGWLAFLLVPQVGRFTDLRSQRQILNTQVSEAKQKLVRLPDLQKQWADLKKQFELEPLALPVAQQLPELLEKITQAARAADVRLNGVKPQKEVAELAPSASGYLELPIEVDASAGYHQLGAFLDSLEQSESLVRVVEFKIRSDPKDIWNHRAAFILQAYLLPASETKK